MLVEAGWRVDELVAAMARRSLEPEATGVSAGTTVVRTGFTGSLVPVADRWTAGSVKRPPPGFAFDGPRLRWWCVSAGRPAGDGYRLQLGRSDEPAWPAIGSALAAAGVPGGLVQAREDGPVYRITGARRLNRLRELVGDRPAGAPPGAWPGESPGAGI